MSVINLPLLIAEGLATIPTVADLPAGQPVGAIRYVEDIDAFYLFDGTSWFTASGGLITSVSDTSTVDLTVTLGVLSAAVIPGGIDHGGLAGLGDDDHTQYLNTSRADTWLATKTTTNLAEGTNLYYTDTRADARITLQKGAANGLATLDAGSKIPASQLPNSVMSYLGTWAASTNTPTLANGTGDAGDVYVASDAGTVNFGAGNITFAAGDWVIYSGSIWEKSVNSNAVASVNGFTGAVVLDTDDIAEATNLYFTDERAQDAVGTILTDTASVDFTYNDAGNTISAAVLPGGVNHDALLNYVANDHVDHTTVSISTASSTSGLSGGGDLTATRNLVVDIAGTTALGADADAADQVLIYDTSATALKKVTVAELVGSVSGAPVTSKNYLLNSAFQFSQRGSVNDIDPGTLEYTADRWYSENQMGIGSVLRHEMGGPTASIPDSIRAIDVYVLTAPGSPGGTVELSQVLDNITTKHLYDQTASFSAYITALGNVTQVGLQFRYAMSEDKLNSDIGTEVQVAVNSATPTLCSIISQALGTDMTASGVVGVRIRATAVSSGDLSDANNGFRVERTQMVMGQLPTKWSSAYVDTQVELSACRRFFESSYELNTSPGTAVTYGGAFSSSADANAGVDVYGSVRMTTQKREVPISVLVWAPNGTAGEVAHYKAGGATVNQAVSIEKITTVGFVARSPNSGTFMEFDWIADAEIY